MYTKSLLPVKEVEFPYVLQSSFHVGLGSPVSGTAERLIVADHIDTMLRQAAVVLAESGSYQEAARRLGVPVSEVRLRIEKLEATICLGLFDSSSELPVATQEGKILIQRFRESLALIDRTVD